MPYSIIFMLIICLMENLHGETRVDIDTKAYVYGDIVKRSSYRIQKEPISIEEALQKSGVDLDDKSHLALGVTLYRVGDVTIQFDPRKDMKLLRSEVLRKYDRIVVMDIRKHPAKALERETRISKMLELGSTDVGGEIIQLAKLRCEYVNWKRKTTQANIRSLDDFLVTEVESLKLAGHADKFLGLVELHRGNLLLMGLGKDHTKIIEDDKLIELLKATKDKQ